MSDCNCLCCQIYGPLPDPFPHQRKLTEEEREQIRKLVRDAWVRALGKMPGEREKE